MIEAEGRGQNERWEVSRTAFAYPVSWCKTRISGCTSHMVSRGAFGKVRLNEASDGIVKGMV
jgi:hypothetical protein